MKGRASTQVGVAFLAVALVGCGAAAPAPAAENVHPAPVAQAVPVAPASASAAPETPDENFRYRPPLAEATSGWRPPPVAEVRLPGGARALVLEDHGLPLVTVHVALRIEARAAIPGLDGVAMETLLDSPGPGGGPSARAALAALGATAHVDNQWDRVGITLTVAASVAGEALAAAVRAFRAEPRAEALEGARRRGIEETERAAGREAGAVVRPRNFRALIALLPADHRYREPVPTTADMRRITIADVARRQGQLALADRLRVAAAGDVTPDALRGALEAATRGWRAGKGARPAPPKLARGVILVEEEGAKNVQVLVALPEADPRWDLWPFVDRALEDALFPRLRREVTSGWSEGQVASFELADLQMPYVALTVQPAEAAKAAGIVLDVLDHAASWDFPEETIASVRRANLRFLEGSYASRADAVRWLAWTASMDLPADQRARLYDVRVRAGRAEVMAAAASRFKRADARVVVSGAVGGLEAEMGKLGLGKPAWVRHEKDGGARARGAVK